MYVDWNVSPRGRYIAVQCEPLRRDPLERNSGGRRSTIDRSLVPPPGENIPIYIKLLQVDDSVTEEGDSEWAVKRLCNNRSGGPSDMQAENFK